jgi:hypothetical protein
MTKRLPDLRQVVDQASTTPSAKVVLSTGIIRAHER